MSRNLEAHMDVLHYGTFALEAADDAHNGTVYRKR